MGCGKIRKAVATVPAPDSYPHVTCGSGPQASTRCSCHGRPGDGSFTLAGCARLSASGTGRGLACSGTGPGPRCLPRVEQGPHDLSGLAGRVQPHWSLNAQISCSRRPVSSRSRALVVPDRLARVGDRAQHPVPRLEQSEPDRPPGPGMAGPGQGMPQRVGHELMTPRTRCPGCVLPCPTGAGWRR